MRLNSGRGRRMDLLEDVRAQIEGRALRGGGWASGNSSQAVTETTCLALLAIAGGASPARDRGLHLLTNLQNTDGSWPAFQGDDAEGCWVTSLAVVTRRQLFPSAAGLQKATRWLLKTKGCEGHWFWKWKFRTLDRRVQFNPDKYGWPWLPGTVSWVIPTAFSLIALEQQFPCCEDQEIPQRIQLGREMLRDRACPQGGWNAGNGMVNGAALLPHVDTTAIALLALKETPADSVTATSLRWLRSAAVDCQSEYSLAWAALAFSIHQDPLFELCIERLLKFLPKRLLKSNTETLSIAALALDAAANDNNPFRAM